MSVFWLLVGAGLLYVAARETGEVDTLDLDVRTALTFEPPAIYDGRPAFLEQGDAVIIPLARDYTPPGGSAGVQPDPWRFREFHELVEEELERATDISAAFDRARERFNDLYVRGYLDDGELVLFVVGESVPGLQLYRAVKCVRAQLSGTMLRPEFDGFSRTHPGGRPSFWREWYDGYDCEGVDPVDVAYTLTELP